MCDLLRKCPQEKLSRERPREGKKPNKDAARLKKKKDLNAQQWPSKAVKLKLKACWKNVTKRHCVSNCIPDRVSVRLVKY